MTLQVVSALVERRREIMRELVYLQGEARRCEEAIGHIDATIKLVDPAFNLEEVKPKKPVTWDEIFRPGEAPVLALEVLREAQKPLSTIDITKALLAKRDEPDLTRHQFETLNRKISAGLNSKFRQGVIRKAGRVQGSNRAVIWELVE